MTTATIKHLNDLHHNHVADRCAISGASSCDAACELEEFAPHVNLPGGGVRCGCTSCAQMRWDDYGCDHAIDAGCRCIETALHGTEETERDAEELESWAFFHRNADRGIHENEQRFHNRQLVCPDCIAEQERQAPAPEV